MARKKNVDQLSLLDALLGQNKPLEQPKPAPAAPVEPTPAPLPPDAPARLSEEKVRYHTRDVIDAGHLGWMRSQVQGMTLSAGFDPTRVASDPVSEKGGAALLAKQREVEALGAGWARPAVMEMDAQLWGRWQWWLFAAATNEIPDGPIPQIDLYGSHEAGNGPRRVRQMLEHCISAISLGNRHDAIYYMIDWLAWALGIDGQKTLPAPRYVSELAATLLYEKLVIGLLQAWPADYFGELFCDISHGQGSAFYPTPLPLCDLMAQLVHGESASEEAIERHKRSSAYDPAVGTGRTLLAASNHNLQLYGQDIDARVLRVTHINLFLYAPWGAMPLPHLFDRTLPEPLPLAAARMACFCELAMRSIAEESSVFEQDGQEQ
jgi:hypothetical protein